jgi:hypothetical protein
MRTRKEDTHDQDRAYGHGLKSVTEDEGGETNFVVTPRQTMSDKGNDIQPSIDNE